MYLFVEESRDNTGTQKAEAGTENQGPGQFKHLDHKKTQIVFIETNTYRRTTNFLCILCIMYWPFSWCATSSFKIYAKILNTYYT